MPNMKCENVNTEDERKKRRKFYQKEHQRTSQCELASLRENAI